MHRLLKRQLKRHLGEAELPPELESLLRAVSAAYEQSDADREMLERSLELSSQELLQANAELRTILHSFPDLFFRIDANGTITYYQAGSSKDLYDLHTSLIGKRIQDIPVNDIGPRFESAIKEVNATGGMVRLEYTLARKGETKYYEARLLPIIKRQILVIVRNITPAKRFEQNLLEEKERLAVTLRSIGDGVITTDVQGRVVLLNKVAEALTGWSHEQAVGLSINEVFCLLDAKSGNSCASPVDEALRTGAILELPKHRLLRHRDGSLRLVADSVAPIKDQQSRIIGTVLVFRDITEKTKLEEEFFKSAKLESIGVLAGGIAHDFNNILNAILGNITLARMDADGKQGLHQRLIRAEKAAFQARELTQQLLTFAKGGAPVKRISRLDELIWDNVRFVLSGSNVRANFAIADDLWPVEVDRGQFSQVINNLVINAKQAMPEGGAVDIEAHNLHVAPKDPLPLRPGRYIAVSVKDHGVGIASENVIHIFDPYYTTKEQGSGLGLATCYSIISKHEGHIEVVSSPGAGSTFTIYLPATSEDASTHQESREGAVLGHGRILIMDDEEAILEATCELLERTGFRTTGVKDGRRAVERYVEAREAGDPYDVVILDLTVPGGMGGKDAIKALLEVDPGVRAIVSSGYSQDPVMANYRAHGFRDVLAKPYKVGELTEALARLLSAMPG